MSDSISVSTVFSALNNVLAFISPTAAVIKNMVGVINASSLKDATNDTESPEIPQAELNEAQVQERMKHLSATGGHPITPGIFGIRRVR